MINSNNTSQPEASCAVCLRSFPLNSLNECQCGELLCGEADCHSYACACTDDNPDAQRLRSGLRAAIRERFQLASAKAIVGDSFPINLEARLVELTNLEAGLRAELDMLHLLEDELVA
jgi:hypothetical protein